MNEADDVKMLLEAQRDAFRAEGIVTPQVRVDRLIAPWICWSPTRRNSAKPLPRISASARPC